MSASFTYDGLGRRTRVTYPDTKYYTYDWEREIYIETAVPGVELNHFYGAMGRPERVQRFTPATNSYDDLVRGLQFNAAGQMTSLTAVRAAWNGSAWVENPVTGTRSYNVRGQMTRMTAPGEVDLEYRLSATANDGRITQMKDWISGEEVNYQFDALGRLTSAVTTGPEWGNGFVYDGFGNLLQKNVTKGSAPALSIQVNGSTNRQVGVSYDANGNVTNDGRAYTWDVENRLIAAATVNGPEEHGYGADNRRLWRKKPDGTIEVYFYAPDGMLLGIYNPGLAYGYVGVTRGNFTPGKTKYWMGSRLLVDDGQVVWQDRLGSVVKRGTATYKYYAWGEERTIGQTLTGKEQFGTYPRGDQTGLDYAVNRWYSNTQGRFLTADPYQASGGAADPGSWNRYGYVQGDPVNLFDPVGLQAARPIFYCDPFYEEEGCVLRVYMFWDGGISSGGPRGPSEQGGGGGGGYVQVQPKVPAGNRYTRDQMRGLTNGLNNALTHTDQVDCATFFAGGDEDPSLRVAGVLEHTLYRLVPLPQGPGTGAQTIDLSNVVINTAGAFFNAAPNANGT